MTETMIEFRGRALGEGKKKLGVCSIVFLFYDVSQEFSGSGSFNIELNHHGFLFFYFSYFLFFSVPQNPLPTLVFIIF